MAATTDVDIESRSRQRSAWVRIAAALGVAALFVVPLLPFDQVAGIIRPSDRFRPAGSLMGTPMAVGETILVGILMADGRVHVDAAEPVIEPGSAMASVELLACHQVEPRTALGSVHASELRRYCDPVAPAEGATIGGEEPATYVVAAIHALEPGTITIDGVAITHSRGPFHRTEHTGLRVELDVT